MNSAPAIGTEMARFDRLPLYSSATRSDDRIVADPAPGELGAAPEDDVPERAPAPQVTEPDAKAAPGPAPLPTPMAAWVCGLLQGSDSFYPTGSYAHSFGLEGLVQEGVVHNRDSLRAFLMRSALPALGRTELPIAAHAWRAFGGPDWKTIGELCVLSSALKTSREARVASENIGRQRAELVANLRASLLAREFLRRATEGNWPCATGISAALEGRVFDAPLQAVLAGVYYTSVASLLSAAMKILRLGQNGSQSLLTEALSAAPEIIRAAEATPLEEVGWFNPWLDIAAARHETADGRMFIS